MSLRTGRLTWCRWRHLRLASCLSGFRRPIYSLTGKWEKRLNRDIRLAVEEYWKPRLKAEDEAKMRASTPGKDKFYVLSMFPYPSGKLHMGHVRVYTISDTMARYHRLLGHEVIHPMGWDAFGLPAENAAIERKELPQNWTYSNIKAMREQLDNLSCSFDWDMEVTTCDPSYYKWTQYIFLKMYEAGLVYRRQGEVNWDPVDQTVLADEQIDEQGMSWRSGAKVEKRYLEQWYIKTTAYSQSLLESLETLDPYLWKEVIAIQKQWIGDCSGCRIEFKVKKNGKVQKDPLSVYTHTPELLHGVSHIVLADTHRFNNPLFHKQQLDWQITLLTLEAEHPVTNVTMPIVVSSSREFLEGTDSVLGIPCMTDEDKVIANKLQLDWQSVLDRKKDRIINSDAISGLSRKDAFHAVTRQAREGGYGGHLVSPSLNDWLISRQRYWGTPIPMIHCDSCGTVPVPYEDLPVTLPHVTKFTGKGASPLTQNKEWLSVRCPKCGSDATRETDTMDTFVDSSWYFLRYLDSKNSSIPCDPEKANKYMPVDLYVGGKEHALLHLYYARFFNHFLCDMGVTKHREPFVNLLTQGMVKGKSYKLKTTGQYIHRDDVDFSGAKPVQKETGELLIEQWEKMSKSKYNGYDPEDVIKEYGTDSTRLCILSNVAPKYDRNWSFEVYTGVTHWQVRVWSLITALIEAKQSEAPMATHNKKEEFEKLEKHIRFVRNDKLRDITHHLNKTFLLNTAISKLHEYVSELKKIPAEHIPVSCEFERAIADLVIIISPFAPNFVSELWAGLQSVKSHLKTNHNWDSGVRDQRWPELDEDLAMPLAIKCNVSVLGQITVPLKEFRELNSDKAISLAKMTDLYKNMVSSHTVKDILFFKETNLYAKVTFIVPELEAIPVERKQKKKKKVKADSSVEEQQIKS